MDIDKKVLPYFLKDALAPYSENFRILDRRNPVRIQLNGTNYSFVSSFVHDSGEDRDNDDESRIQLPHKHKEELKKRQGRGDRVAVIGFFKTGDVFIAWDPRYAFSLQAKKRVSLYARWSQYAPAAINQAAVHQFRSQKLAERSFVIALPASALGFYLENIERFHALPSKDSIVDLVKDHTEAFVDSGIGTSGKINVGENSPREKFTFERTSYPRDPRFKKQVLEAYEQTCCICGRQLGIIQAAHIIPHSVENSSDHVTNGLALCIEHHRLYDDALLLPGPDYQLVFNNDRAEYLKQVNQDKGLEEIRKFDEQPFTVPEDQEHRPQRDYLKRGLESRMGK